MSDTEKIAARLDRLAAIDAAMPGFRSFSTGNWEQGGAVLEQAAQQLRDLQARLNAELARSQGIARRGCPACPEGTDNEVMGDTAIVCVRCGTRYYDASPNTP